MVGYLVEWRYLFLLVFIKGPGCSSYDGLFLEIGPFRVNENGQVSYLEYHWAKQAHVLFCKFDFFIILSGSAFGHRI